MRHRKAGVKLNRTSSHRKAMFRNMVTSLLKYERIQTTDAKAKEVRRWADHVITLAKRGDLHARRQALSIVRETDVVHKLFEEASERFGAMEGGYTRIVKVGRRRGDAAPVSIIELVGPAEGKPRRRKKRKKKSTPQTVAAAQTTAATDVPAEQLSDQEETGGGESSQEAAADELESSAQTVAVSAEDQRESAGESTGEDAVNGASSEDSMSEAAADDSQAAAPSDEQNERADKKA